MTKKPHLYLVYDDDEPTDLSLAKFTCSWESLGDDVEYNVTWYVNGEGRYSESVVNGTESVNGTTTFMAFLPDWAFDNEELSLGVRTLLS